MLTLERLKAMKPGEIFDRGEADDLPGDLNMTGKGERLRWVAVRGKGIPDWAIYTHYAYMSDEYVRDSGDKVHSEQHVRQLVRCDDEAFSMYRH